jgi:hypothetical protein
MKRWVLAYKKGKHIAVQESVPVLDGGKNPLEISNSFDSINRLNINHR